MFSLFGGVLALLHIYGYENDIILYSTLLAVLSLVPAILIAPMVRIQGKTPQSITEFVNIYSVSALVLAIFIVVIKFIQTLDF